jgi:hypothetical protein
VSSNADKDVQLIRDAVKERVLLTFGYRFKCGDDEGDVRFHLQTPKAIRRSQFIVNENERIVRLYVYLTDDGYFPSLHGRVAELVHRLNEQIILGHYAYDCDTGGVLLHLVEDFRVVHARRWMSNECSTPLPSRSRHGSSRLQDQAARDKTDRCVHRFVDRGGCQ